MVQAIGSTDEFFDILRAAAVRGQLVVAVFEAEWCGTYKQISPFVGELAQKFIATTKFIKIDSDECDELCRKFGIKTMPSFLFFVSGQQIDEIKGASRDKLQHKVQQYQPSSSSSSDPGRSISSTPYITPATPLLPVPIESRGNGSSSSRPTSSAPYSAPATTPPPALVENQFFDVTFPSLDSQWNRGMQYESRRFTYSVLAEGFSPAAGYAPPVSQ